MNIIPSVREKKGRPQEPGQLPRFLVGSPEIYPGHVDEDEDDHGGRPPIMEVVDEPAERDLRPKGKLRLM